MRFEGATVCAALVVGCGAPKKADLGLVLAERPETAPMSAAVREGVTLAVEQWNAQPKAIRAHVREIDGGCDPAVAVPAVRAARDEGVTLFVGELCSAATVAIADDIGSSAVLVAPTASDPAVTWTGDAVRPTVFRVARSDAQLAADLAAFAHGELEAGAAAIVAGPSEAAGRVADAFAPAFQQLGGRVVVDERWHDDAGLEAALDRVMAEGADVVLLPDAYDVAGRVAERAREKGISATFLGSDGWDSENLDGEALAGGWYAHHWAPGDPLDKDWAGRFVARFGHEPDALSAMGYEAATTLLQGLADARSTNPREVAEAIEARGGFDARHDTTSAGVVVEVPVIPEGGEAPP
jgi:branched-chain amino acid transport system substrate-binding protein